MSNYLVTAVDYFRSSGAAGTLSWTERQFPNLDPADRHSPVTKRAIGLDSYKS